MSANDGVEWRVTPGPSPYPETRAEMETRATASRSGSASELVQLDVWWALGDSH